jgi:hypothetical protein
MKRIPFAVAFLLLGLISFSTFAQQPVPAPTTVVTPPAQASLPVPTPPTDASAGVSPGTGAVFSPADIREARETLQILAGGFGIELGAGQPVAVPTPAPAEPAPKKSMADVADKALEMSAKLVTSIAGKMEQVAPRVWEVLVRQQYAKAIGELIAPFGLFWGFLIAAFIIRKVWKLSEREKDDCVDMDSMHTWRGIITFILPLIVCVFLGISFFCRFSDSIMYLINPEYYAVRDLLQMLLKPGSL